MWSPCTPAIRVPTTQGGKSATATVTAPANEFFPPTPPRTSPASYVARPRSLPGPFPVFRRRPLPRVRIRVSRVPPDKFSISETSHFGIQLRRGQEEKDGFVTFSGSVRAGCRGSRTRTKKKRGSPCVCCSLAKTNGCLVVLEHREPVNGDCERDRAEDDEKRDDRVDALLLRVPGDLLLACVADVQADEEEEHSQRANDDARVPEHAPVRRAGREARNGRGAVDQEQRVVRPPQERALVREVHLWFHHRRHH
ncbi:MAG: hypothetical protein BJ554DRAFT_3505, partial [Olpidium bornovanus]